ncbi:MAG: hypothetical protein K2M37_05650 [Muribaculaceae bacterium]|nr:hypothetical protein [Muribaculaceae bacterium]
MTAKQLIEELSKYPQDMEVLKRYQDTEHGAEGYEETYEIYIANHEIILE